MTRPLLILGSGSPRRHELLKPFFRLQVKKAEIDERPKRGETPARYTRRLSLEKWLALEERLKSTRGVLLTADTTVAWAGKIFGKPKDRREAKRMLQSLSGKSHRVMTSVVVGALGLGERPKPLLVKTTVRFRQIEAHEWEAYLNSGEWRDKAGAYAIQGRAAKFVDELQGSLTNVIGLPLKESLGLCKTVFAKVHKFDKVRLGKNSQ